MTDHSVSRRLFLSAVAAAPAAPVLVASDRIAIFDPPPERVRIVTAAASSVVPPPTYTAAEIQQIQSQGKDVRITVPANAGELDRLLPEADVVFGAISPEMLAKARNLRWLQATEGGVDAVLFPQLISSQVVVTNGARVFAPPISETVMGMILSLSRGFNKYYIPQFAKRTWNAERNLVEIDGMTMGIVGLGGLGSATAERAHYGFHMRILATDAKPMAKPVFVDTLREPAWLMEMIPQADVVVCSAPYTRETAKMFNEKVFRAMKKTAYFINISRGELVEEGALVQALKEGWIAGAGLDVVYPEPYPPTGAYWDCPNLVITCHTSGFAPLRQSRLVGLLAENVRRYSSGLPLINVVDKQRGY